MADLARQRPLGWIGFDTEFKYDRPGVVIDRDRTAHDPAASTRCCCRWRWPSRTGATAGCSSISSSTCAGETSCDAVRAVFRMPCCFVGHFAQVELFCLWQLGLPEPPILWDTWVCEKALHLGRIHKRYKAGPGADAAEQAGAEEEARQEEQFRYTLVASCRRHGVEYPFAGDKDRLGRSFLEHPDDAPFTRGTGRLCRGRRGGGGPALPPAIARGLPRRRPAPPADRGDGLGHDQRPDDLAGRQGRSGEMPTGRGGLRAAPGRAAARARRRGGDERPQPQAAQGLLRQEGPAAAVPPRRHVLVRQEAARGLPGPPPGHRPDPRRPPGAGPPGGADPVRRVRGDRRPGAPRLPPAGDAHGPADQPLAERAGPGPRLPAADRARARPGHRRGGPEPDRDRHRRRRLRRRAARRDVQHRRRLLGDGPALLPGAAARAGPTARRRRSSSGSIGASATG